MSSQIDKAIEALEVDSEDSPERLLTAIEHALDHLATLKAEQEEHEPNILEEANAIVGIGHGRSLRYGHPAENFAHTAALWRAAFGWEVDAPRVAMSQILLKVSRECNSHTRDNLTDIAGYSRTLEMVHEYFEEARAVAEAQKKIDEHVSPPGESRCPSLYRVPGEQISHRCQLPEHHDGLHFANMGKIDQLQWAEDDAEPV